jgi:hypothetical protein
MKRLVNGLLGVALVLFGVAAPSFADENEITALKEQVDKLNRRISELESKQKETPTYVAPSGAAPVNAIEGALSGIRLSGYVDTAWHWNFNNPNNVPSAPTGTREQSIRVFDQDEGSFTLQAVKLTLEKPAAAEGGVGFRTDFLYGEDAEITTPIGSTIDEFDIEQAYVEARLPIHALDGNEVFGNSLYLRGGHYVTLAGAEVIESKDNWNITRSIMFGWAIPFTHNGIRAVYDLWGGKVTVTTGLTNGWDQMEDNNNYATWEGQIAWKPNDKFLFTGTTYMGPENPNTDGHKRYLIDFVALWKATDKLSLMANFDFGSERRFSGIGGNSVDSFENAQWHGYALYARYQATDKFAMSTRWEIFVDDDMFRTGGGVAPTIDETPDGPVSSFQPVERRYWEWTYTAEYKLYDNLITRAEYRYDWSEAPIFNGESSQQTVSAQLIYNFA